jgi:hypothetical protein
MRSQGGSGASLRRPGRFEGGHNRATLQGGSPRAGSAADHDRLGAIRWPLFAQVMAGWLRVAGVADGTVVAVRSARPSNAVAAIRVRTVGHRGRAPGSGDAGRGCGPPTGRVSCTLPSCDLFSLHRDAGPDGAGEDAHGLVVAPLPAQTRARLAGAAGAGCSTCSSSRHGTCSIGANPDPAAPSSGPDQGSSRCPCPARGSRLEASTQPLGIQKPATRPGPIHCPVRSRTQMLAGVAAGGRDAADRRFPKETRLHLTSYRHVCSQRRDYDGKARNRIGRY